MKHGKINRSKGPGGAAGSLGVTGSRGLQYNTSEQTRQVLVVENIKIKHTVEDRRSLSHPSYTAGGGSTQTGHVDPPVVDHCLECLKSSPDIKEHDQNIV